MLTIYIYSTLEFRRVKLDQAETAEFTIVLKQQKPQKLFAHDHCNVLCPTQLEALAHLSSVNKYNTLTG